MTRLCLTRAHGFSGLVRLLAGAALVPAAAVADVTDYAAARYVSYTQTSDAAPTAPESWFFRSLLVSDTPNEVQAAAVSFDAPAPVSYTLNQSISTQYYVDSVFFADEPYFLLSYPATTYTFTADRGFGVESGTLEMPADLYSVEIPALTGTTFSRLQGCDAEAAFDGTVGAFSPAPGTNVAWTEVVLIRDGFPGAVWSVVMAPTDTNFEIPPGVMLPGTGYSIGVTYFNAVRTANAGFGAATSEVEFYRGTGASFTTRQSCGRVAEDYMVSMSCTGAGQLCGNVYELSVYSCGLLEMEFTMSPTHCSNVGVQVSLDGALVMVSGPLGPGQGTGLVELGPVTPGVHTLSIEGVGYVGGCNSGVLQTWGGTLRLYRCMTPVVVAGPDPAEVCPLGTATFNVTAEGTPPFSYQWQVEDGPFNWTDIAAGADILLGGQPAGHGSGSTSDTLVWSDAVLPAGVAGPISVRCLVQNGCSGVTSAEATLTIGCGCNIADIVSIGGLPPPDGLLTGDDFNAFIAAFAAADPLADIVSIGGLPPPDGLITGDDFNAFIGAFASGCP